MRKSVLLAAAFAAVAACTPSERARLEAEISGHEQSKEILVAQKVRREGLLASLDQRAGQVEEEMRRHDNEVEAYLMNHKLAVGCMAAAGVVLDDGNEYSQDVKDISGVATLFCVGGALLSPEFGEEVVGVADYLGQADVRAKRLKSQLGSLQEEAETERSTAAGEQVRLDSLTATIEQLRLRLDQI